MEGVVMGFFSTHQFFLFLIFFFVFSYNLFSIIAASSLFFSLIFFLIFYNLKIPPKHKNYSKYTHKRENNISLPKRFCLVFLFQSGLWSCDSHIDMFSRYVCYFYEVPLTCHQSFEVLPLETLQPNGNH